jgi:hypothetical protein
MKDQSFKVTAPDGSDLKVGRAVLAIAPHTVSICKDGAILCRYEDGVGDYKVDCGEVLLTPELAVEAVLLGWRNLGARTQAEREANLVRVHRAYEEATRQYLKAYGI